MIIKRSITFFLEKRRINGVVKTEDVPIRLRVFWGAHGIEMTTGCRVDACQWDSKKQKVKNGCSNRHNQTAAEINRVLVRKFQEIDKIFNTFEFEDVFPTRNQIKESLSSTKKTIEDVQETVANKKKEIDFWTAFKEFIVESGNQNSWTKSTVEKFAALKNHIINCFGKRVSFSTFNSDGINEFVYYLSHEKNMHNCSIEKQLSFLRWFLRWCYRKGYNNINDFETFRPKLKITKKKIIFLTKQELEKMISYEIPAHKKYLERVRDVFLFSCFTGLRYSDVANLKKCDIKNGYIEVTTIKTADALTIELNSQSEKILNKYANVEFPKDRALPVISNQKMNIYLKELGELVGINEPIHETYYNGNRRVEYVLPKYALLGTHAGRRTFICSALSLGIPAQVVMKWTGHSDYKAMKPYIDIADDVKSEAMKKFNQF